MPASVPQKLFFWRRFIWLLYQVTSPLIAMYEQTVPYFPYPMVIGLGTVSSQPRVLADGSPKAFAVPSLDYVRDARVNSVAQGVTFLLR